jgi:hypothetical protein
MKKQFIFITGLSGSGKGYFFDHILPKDLFYKVKSMTTRSMRPGEVNGEHYFFVTEDKFNATPRATTLWVNEYFCKERDKKIADFDSSTWIPKWTKSWIKGKSESFQPLDKWLYGVPESEIMSNKGKHLAYDVIQPKYVCQMIDWIQKKGWNYEFKILHFQPPKNNFDIAQKRANMKNDLAVRINNTCDLTDFWDVGLNPDFILQSSVKQAMYPVDMVQYFDTLAEKKKEGDGFRLPSDMKKMKFLHNQWCFVR